MVNITLEELIQDIEKEAKREEFPLDLAIYQSAKKEATKPILYYGNLKSNICFFGRDLGRDEVMAGQPLIGQAGTLVRQVFYQAIHREKTNEQSKLNTIAERAILTNTVPYKPPENKAYSVKVKKRFRPFIEQFLTIHWQGNQIITLGTEAFKWYQNYSDKETFNNFWSNADQRYHQSIEVNLIATDKVGKSYQKKVTIYPLPHPSPLNQRYYNLFPAMLQARLSQLAF
ncbi:MAG: uracil-DNA glycosylase [Cyanobacterium sp. T60_A2020_053]|nr:uracil-DNA glycosylase [Cyanobacterium sp. T60_A2020_053]